MTDSPTRPRSLVSLAVLGEVLKHVTILGAFFALLALMSFPTRLESCPSCFRVNVAGHVTRPMELDTLVRGDVVAARLRRLGVRVRVIGRDGRRQWMTFEEYRLMEARNCRCRRESDFSPFTALLDLD